MPQVGGELEQMVTLKGAFDKQSGEVQALMSSIRGQLDNTWWKGPAADRFREAWQSEFEPALRKLESALTDAGHEVQQRHDALDAASR